MRKILKPLLICILLLTLPLYAGFAEEVLPEAGTPAAEAADTQDEAPAEAPEEDAESTPDESEEGMPEDAPEGMPEGMPGGFSRPSGGGGRRGGRGGSGKSSSVTPGKALTSDHASGTGDMRLYGAASLEISGESMESLVLGNETLDLTCEKGVFTAALEDDTLILTAAQKTEWRLSQAVLKTLNLSGIQELLLVTDDLELALPTDLEFSGTFYGQERAAGYVSSDFILCSRESGWIVSVENRTYLLNNGEWKTISEEEGA